MGSMWTSIEPWSISIGFLLAGPLAGLFFRLVLERKLRKLAEASETRIDDLVVEVVSRYLPIWTTLGGIPLALSAAPSLDPRVVTITERCVLLGFIASITFAASKFAAGALQLYAESSGAASKAASLSLNVVRLIVVSLGIFLALANLGISITPLLTALGVGSLAVALALQDSLANFFAGLHVIASRKIDVGDSVRLEGGQEGIVVDIGPRTTRIRDFDNCYVLVPNSRVSQGIVVNLSQPGPEIDAVLRVPIDASGDLRRVVAIGEETICVVAPTRGVPGEEPLVRIRLMPEGFAMLELRLRTANPIQRGLALHELSLELADRLRREGISFVARWREAGPPPIAAVPVASGVPGLARSG
jgi:small-conductance mechanosensitive channel